MKFQETSASHVQTVHYFREICKQPTNYLGKDSIFFFFD